ncbi:MAG: DUF2116 family Zn-ribbon domain-containing protein [Candidatus Methanomethylophilaceae archaeon]
MAEAIERIPQHRHCYVCGRAFVGEGRYCSDACKTKKTAELKSSKRKLLIIWAAAVALMIIGIAAYGYL